MDVRGWAIRGGFAVVACGLAAMPLIGQASATTTSTAGGDVKTSAMTDANILAVMHQANTGEIKAAQLALQKATSGDVKSFAQTMIHDHRQLDADGAKVAKEIGLTPEPPADDSLPEHARHELSHLQSLQGGAFDQAYVSAQVADHQTVLNLLKQAEGTAEHAQVKSAVRTAMDKVESHLDKAQKLEQQLRGAA